MDHTSDMHSTHNSIRIYLIHSYMPSSILTEQKKKLFLLVFYMLEEGGGLNYVRFVVCYIFPAKLF